MSQKDYKLLTDEELLDAWDVLMDAYHATPSNAPEFDRLSDLVAQMEDERFGRGI